MFEKKNDSGKKLKKTLDNDGDKLLGSRTGRINFVEMLCCQK